MAILSQYLASPRAVTLQLARCYQYGTAGPWWHSGRTSVSDWRTFAVLPSTCSWRV